MTENQTTNPFSERKQLTFEQAEGHARLPVQLAPKSISIELRALLWQDLYKRIKASAISYSYRSDRVGDPWNSILEHYHVFHEYGMIDEYEDDLASQVNKSKIIITQAVYYQVFGFIQFILRHPECPPDFRDSVEQILSYGRAPYRVFDGDTLIPISSETDRATVAKAFTDLSTYELNGARKHLRAAGEEMTNGNFAASVRESIHSVESLARILEHSGSLAGALTKLQKSMSIHPSLSQGFQKIYGYTSDEKGIRHPLLDNPSKVDEDDALFMMGACSAFVSYLIGKAAKAGLLTS